MEKVRTDYTAVVVECESTGDVGMMLADGYRGDDDGVLSAIFDGRVFAHDILEHVPGPEHIGTVADELEALGAVWHVRPHITHTIKYDIANTLCYGNTEYVPRTTVLDPVVRSEMRHAAVRGVRMYYDEYDGYGEVPTYGDVLCLAREVYHALQYGYTRAAMHYGDLPVCDMFDSITTACKTMLDNWRHEEYLGCEFEIKLDWENVACYVSTEPENWNYDYE